jgi:uncharacterized protein YgiM (DUF1202 family)
MKTEDGMKKWLLVWLGCLVATCAWASKEMSVQVREGQLRNRGSFLGTVVGTVAYGDRVTVKQSQAGWIEVSASGGATGWIHESALTPKRVVLSSGDADAQSGGVGSDEIALAGKGFSKEVEAEYKKQNANLDYAWVDRMLGYGLPADELVAFLAQGHLAK